MIVMTFLFFLTVSGANAAQTRQSYYSTKEFDDLRVSNDQFQGDVSSSGSFDHVTNHIGKPLVYTTSNPSLLSGYVTEEPLNHGHNQKPKKFLSTARPAQTDGRDISRQTHETTYVSDRCTWLNITELKNYTLMKRELIMRDNEEQPCYVLSIIAYIRLNESHYFPLDISSVDPQYSRIVYEEPKGGASVVSPLNCSAMYGLRSFKEEITIFVNCGYLILQMQGHGSYLSLNSIAFYQHAKVPVKVPPARWLRLAPKKRPEDLVFESTQSSPLFSIPMVSRYICQNRVELTGQKTTLVLHRFELQRLFYPTHLDEHKQPAPSLDATITALDDSLIDNDRNTSTKERSTVRIKRSIQFKDPRTVVIRCGEPSKPFTPLTSLNSDVQKTNDTQIYKILADRLKHSGTSTTGMFLSFGANKNDLNIIYYALTLTIITYFGHRLMRTNTSI